MHEKFTIENELKTSMYLRYDIHSLSSMYKTTSIFCSISYLIIDIEKIIFGDEILKFKYEIFYKRILSCPFKSHQMGIVETDAMNLSIYTGGDFLKWSHLEAFDFLPSTRELNYDNLRKRILHYSFNLVKAEELTLGSEEALMRDYSCLKKVIANCESKFEIYAAFKPEGGWIKREEFNEIIMYNLQSGPHSFHVLALMEIPGQEHAICTLGPNYPLGLHQPMICQDPISKRHPGIFEDPGKSLADVDPEDNLVPVCKWHALGREFPSGQAHGKNGVHSANYT
jgi:hypothetical protein